MKITTIYKSDAFEAIHTSAAALQKVGAIDAITMRKFDASCLAIPASLKPTQIKRILQNEHIGQPVLAKYLNTSE
jgi:putative transcriptional regulator